MANDDVVKVLGDNPNANEPTGSTPADSTPEEVSKPSTEEKESIGQEEQTIPYSRFHEKVEETNALKQKLEKVSQLEDYAKVDDLLDFYKSGEKHEEVEKIAEKRKLSSLENEIKQEKRNREIDTFLRSNPDNETFRQQLGELSHQLPGQSVAQVWKNYFEPAIETGRNRSHTKITEKEKKQVESGQGSRTDTTATLSREEFSKLPFDKKRQYIKQLEGQGLLTDEW